MTEPTPTTTTPADGPAKRKSPWPHVAPWLAIIGIWAAAFGTIAVCVLGLARSE